MAIRELRRDHIMGHASRTPDNYRTSVRTLSQAAAYVASAGWSAEDQELYRIDRVIVGEARPTRRRSWDQLSPSYQRRLLGSSVMKAEARRHDMSVPEWYEVAPTLKGARGHGGQHRESYARYPTVSTWYEVYMERDSEPALRRLQRQGASRAKIQRTERRWSREAKAAWKVRRPHRRGRRPANKPLADLQKFLAERFGTIAEELQADEAGELLRQLEEEEW